MIKRNAHMRQAPSRYGRTVKILPNFDIDGMESLLFTLVESYVMDFVCLLTKSAIQITTQTLLLVDRCIK